MGKYSVCFSPKKYKKNMLEGSCEMTLCEAIRTLVPNYEKIGGVMRLSIDVCDEADYWQHSKYGSVDISAAKMAKAAKKVKSVTGEELSAACKIVILDYKQGLSDVGWEDARREE